MAGRLRPEDNPWLRLWIYPKEAVSTNAGVDALLASGEALIEYVMNHKYQVPSWIVVAWWFGAAAVVFDLSVADLSNHLRTWFERVLSAVMYVEWLYSSPPGSDANKDEQNLWYCFSSDTRHAGLDGHIDNATEWLCEHGVQQILPDYPLPSAMQRWGFQSEAGTRTAEEDKLRRDCH